MTRWCILRTAGPRTLPLARSLADAGFEAWTPIFVERRRRPRSKVLTETDTAGMPTFVFVPDRYRADLMRLLLPHAPNPHPAFSIFRYAGGDVTVADRELERLREIEAEQRRRSDERVKRATQRLKRRGLPFDEGQTVRITAGAFAGFTAVVDTSDERRTRLTFHLFGRVSQIETGTSQLRNELLSDA